MGKFKYLFKYLTDTSLLKVTEPKNTLIIEDAYDENKKPTLGYNYTKVHFSFPFCTYIFLFIKRRPGYRRRELTKFCGVKKEITIVQKQVKANINDGNDDKEVSYYFVTESIPVNSI